MTFAVLIELPLSIKRELIRLCVGLPSANWNTDDNLYICLHKFGKLTDPERWDIIDQLAEIDVTSFLLQIKGLNYSPKRDNGLLWASLEVSDKLDMLKIDIENRLRSFNHGHQENNYPKFPAIRLGTVQNESPERIADYFEANGNFISSIFEVQDFAWAQLIQTDKRNFYKVEKRYPLA